jgi:3-oxoacyl-[acyl-carrier-protein] synthase-3
MYINSISHYLPKHIIRNDYFKKVNGLSEEWILSRTGIEERRKALSKENTNTMAIEAVNVALNQLPYSIADIDLIIGATYTPYDTVGTLAHSVQNEFNISDAKAISLSAACSSFINAIEIVEGYFATNKASKALVVASEHNTAYHNEKDMQAGHLWGDGAAAVFISKEQLSEKDYQIVDVITKGLGNIGKSINGVSLHPTNGGIKMPFGKDVFINANKYMTESIIDILNRNNLSIDDINYVIPHQANIRIIENVGDQLKINNEKVLVNIDKLGNTGCASTPIAFSQNQNKFKNEDLVAFTVFGGGYSSGAMLVKK